jgi:hypothetical protein
MRWQFEVAWFTFRLWRCQVGRLTNRKERLPSSLEAMLGAMYAARKFAEEVDRFLGITAIGIVPKEMGRDLEDRLRLLRERLAELPQRS